jgi:hypothetical protein
MKTISFFYHSARVGRRLETALFVLGLQLSLAGFPIGSLEQRAETMSGTLSPGKIFRVILQVSPIVPIRTW